MFAGTGVVTARALAYDANNIKQVLENPALPAQLGATNKDQMLKMLEINISSDYVRLEQSLVVYILGILNFNDIPQGNEEIAYIDALYNLGISIHWDDLQSSSRSPMSSLPYDDESRI